MPAINARIVLASSSPRRHELLKRLVQRFEILEPVGVDEGAARGSAAEIAEKLAVQKAESVLSHCVARQGSSSVEGAFFLGADTVVAIQGLDGETVLGKPRDRNDARRMLRLLSGRAHGVWTGVAVARSNASVVSSVEHTEVVFKQLSDVEVEAHVATGDWEGKAGAYGIQSEGSTLVESFRGCYYNVVGLPVALTARLLAEAGVCEFACDCLTSPLQARPTESSLRPCGPR